MKTFHFKNLKYCQSALFDGLFEGNDLRDRSYDHAFRFIQPRTFRRVVSKYRRQSGLEGYLLLFAHGDINSNGSWLFLDGNRSLSMQNWIDRHDGEALTILLSCCNIHNYEVSSQKSVIIHPASDIELMKPTNRRIFVPGEGYLDTYYQRMKYIDSP